MLFHLYTTAIRQCFELRNDGVLVSVYSYIKLYNVFVTGFCHHVCFSDYKQSFSHQQFFFFSLVKRQRLAAFRVTEKRTLLCPKDLHLIDCFIFFPF